MFSKIFKKSEAPPNTALAPQPTEIADAAQLAAQAAAQLAARVEWENKLQAAMGDDSALLAVAKDTPLLDIKHAAVLALEGEAALKLAEREFRTHDRRVHRAAKQRYEALVEQRESREQAGQLIATAAALVNESMIPANRLVEFDQAWRALDPALLENEQNAAFADLQAKLTALILERGDHLRSTQRWTADANQALAHLNAVCAEVVADNKEWAELAPALASASNSARATLLAVPAATSLSLPERDASATLMEALQTALHKAAQIEARLAILGELYQGGQSGDIQLVSVQPADADSNPATDPMTPSITPSQRWQALPPIADTHIDKVLNARFEEWQRMKADARKTRQAESKQRAKEKSKATQQAHIETLEAIVKKAEASLAAGHLTETGKHLIAIQEAPGSGAASGALQARINVLQTEYAHLKGWQHWGGGRVRDDLVLEAEALAKVAAAEEDKRAAKLPLKQHAEAIEQLRTRWKELDRLGGATSRELWQRFDDALKTAYLPVAAHLDKLNSERQDNLAARKKLIAALDAVNISDGDNGAAPDWRGIARALDHFQTEWRKLGPVEHTVPHKARDALLERMQTSVARLENPLQETRRGAQLAREEFIARAQALSADAQGRDVVAKVRALQAEWQQHAKSQPLARAVENALWADFKGAIDAVFSQRDAVSSARDAELKTNQTTRETLIARLGELNQDTPPADIKRTIAAAETEWRKAGEAPRSAAAKLDEKFRSACHAALQHIAGSAQRIWHTTCDTLVAKQALCGEAETNTQPAEDIDARWSILPVLPTSWEQALHKRLKAGETKPTDESLNMILLQLESALEMPSPPAFQDARRALKLSMMKSAMEGRDAPAGTKSDIEKLTAAALGYARIDTVQHERLATIIARLKAGDFEVHADKIRLRGR